MKSQPVYCFPLSGPPRTLPAVVDFARAQPGRPSRPPTGTPEHRSAALRVKEGRDGEWIPVDPAFLILHLEVWHGGVVRNLSRTLWSFLCRCCIDRPGRRIQVAGPPEPPTRVIKRTSELSIDAKTYFSASRCAVRGCGRGVVSGSFCDEHIDARFHNAISARDAVVPEKGSLAPPRRLAAEVRLIVSPKGFSGWWTALGQWVSSAPPLTPDHARAFFVNWAVDVMPLIAMGDQSSDRLSLIARLAPPSRQKTQTFLNIAMCTAYIRAVRASAPVLARSVADSLATMAVHLTPISDRMASRLCDRGIAPFISMPAFPAISRRGPTSVSGLLATTVLPQMSSEVPPMAVVFSASALLVMAQIFGTAGDFSFSVVHAPPSQTNAPLVDAAQPLDLSKLLVVPASTRADQILTVANPAALSFTVMSEIIFTLRYKHVRFLGPRIGRAGIRLPTFSGRGGALDPTAGFVWRVILEEAASRGFVKTPPATDAGLVFETRRGVQRFLDVFTHEEIPVRCTAGCSRCSDHTSWHRDRLLTEAAFGAEASEQFVPDCARDGVDLFLPGTAEAAIAAWRNLTDITVSSGIGADLFADSD
jgi:hypothetical protein